MRSVIICTDYSYVVFVAVVMPIGQKWKSAIVEFIYVIQTASQHSFQNISKKICPRTPSMA